MIKEENLSKICLTLLEICLTLLEKMFNPETWSLDEVTPIMYTRPATRDSVSSHTMF
jgi:hypothetical protein